MASKKSKGTIGDGAASSGPCVSKKGMKVPEPTRMNMVSPEAQLVIGVIDKCIEKMKMLTIVPSDPIQPEVFYLGLGEETYLSLSEHLRHVEAFNATGSEEVDDIESKNDDDQLTVDQSRPIDPKSAAAKTKAVQNSLRNLFRNLKDRGPEAQAVLESTTAKTEDKKRVWELVQRLKEFRTVVRERLMTTPVEERGRHQKMKESKQLHQKNLEMVASLEKQISVAILEKDAEMVKRNKTIFQLSNSVQRQERAMEEFVKRMREDAEKQNQSDVRSSEAKQMQLEQESSQLQTQIGNLITEHLKEEVVQRKKKYQVETEIDNWIQKYDADMEKQQAALDDMLLTYEREEAELRQLEAEFRLVDEEYGQVMEARRLAQERREAEEHELMRQTRAAVVLQAAWRGHCTRKALKDKDKKKDKGKKGKKDKKKK